VAVPCKVIDIRDGAIYGAAATTDPATGITASDVAYLMYTSGSTGRPKGVLIKHQNLVNYSEWFNGALGLTTVDRSLLTSSYAFDLGYCSVFPPLFKGAQLHVVRREQFLLPASLAGYLHTHAISFIKMTPGLFSSLINHKGLTDRSMSALRWIILGGEPIIVKDVEAAFARNCRVKVMNHYGPTETTIGSVTETISIDNVEAYKRHPVIGHPISNTEAFVLDSAMQPLPPGVVGDLYLAGDGVGIGYLNQVELTQSRFIHNPYAGEKKLYKTGDLARRIDNGKIVFLGRADSQVKIRGYRVELDEIKSQLLSHPAIVEAVLVFDERHTEKQLCSYLVTRTGVTATELRQYLSATLPDYMIPAHFICVGSIPRTGNGKVDQGALPVPAAAGYAAPVSEVEQKLVAIWAEVLEVNPAPVGVTDNFFALGGHSLKSMMLVTLIGRAFDVDMPIGKVYEKPTIREQAGYLAAASHQRPAVVPIVPAARKEYYPLSIEQKRLYVAQQLEPDSTLYNIPCVLSLAGPLDEHKLEGAFRQLINRHEGLRTSIELVNGEPVQRIHPEVPFSTARYQATEATADDLIAQMLLPFQLDQPPLLRAGLIRITPSRHLLVIDMHHIISDGVSNQILTRDFVAAYAGKALPPLQLHYKDYAEWQNSRPGQAWIGRQETALKRDFQGGGAVISLPRDAVGADPLPAGKRMIFGLEDDHQAFIRRLVAEEGVTLPAVLLTVYCVFLGKLLGQEDVTVCNTTAGRQHPDLQQVVGFFVKILPMRSYPRHDKTFVTLLREVHQGLLRSYDYQMCRHEFIRDTTGDAAARSNAWTEVVFDFQKPGDLRLELENITLEPYAYQADKAPFALMLQVIESKDLEMAFTYKTGFFKESTIRQFIASVRAIVAAVRHNPEVRLEDIRPDHAWVLTTASTDVIEFNF
ncbi:MAG: AMP-binding protein, partial [Cytophagales bacterium]|nr:AMP-binding protein [Cytophagales bacterium]